MRTKTRAPAWQVEMEKELSSDSDSDESGDLAPSPFFNLHCCNKVIGVSFITTETELADWLRSAVNLRRPRTDVVGLCLLRGLPRGRSSCLKLKGKGARVHPNHPSNPIHVLSLCLNNEIIIYQNYPNQVDGPPSKIKELRDLLADRRVRVVGVGLKADMQALERQWGIYIANPLELKGAGRGDKVEEIAESVLKVAVGRKPSRVANLDWGKSRVEGDGEALMFAARDSFLCAEMGLRVV